MDLKTRDVYTHISNIYISAGDGPVTSMCTTSCDLSEIKVDGKHRGKELKEA